MTVPLDMMNDIRSMDAGGVPRAEIARRLGVSRNTVSKYADMDDMSPAAPARRARPALAGHERWVESVLEADLGAPRKQRHTVFRQARADNFCILISTFSAKPLTAVSSPPRSRPFRASMRAPSSCSCR